MCPPLRGAALVAPRQPNPLLPVSGFLAPLNLLWWSSDCLVVRVLVLFLVFLCPFPSALTLLLRNVPPPVFVPRLALYLLVV